MKLKAARSWILRPQRTGCLVPHVSPPRILQAISGASSSTEQRTKSRKNSCRSSRCLSDENWQVWVVLLYCQIIGQYELSEYASQAADTQ